MRQGVRFQRAMLMGLPSSWQRAGDLRAAVPFSLGCRWCTTQSAVPGTPSKCAPTAVRRRAVKSRTPTVPVSESTPALSAVKEKADEPPTRRRGRKDSSSAHDASSPRTARTRAAATAPPTSTKAGPPATHRGKCAPPPRTDAGAPSLAETRGKNTAPPAPPPSPPPPPGCLFTRNADDTAPSIRFTSNKRQHGHGSSQHARTAYPTPSACRPAPAAAAARLPATPSASGHARPPHTWSPRKAEPISVQRVNWTQTP